MKLDKHIANLLYRHECVVVPNFGAFITEWQSAQVVAAENSFLPPRKLVLFNQLIKSNDGLLTNHVAKQENISYEAAGILINSTVNFWIEKLNYKENLTLEKIGEISENSEKNWLFKPDVTHNFLTDAFGLSSFNSAEIVRNNGYVAPVFTEAVAEVETEIISNVTPDKKPIVANKPTEKPVKVVPLTRAINRRNSLLKYAASVAIIGCLSFYGYQQYHNYGMAQSQQIALENAKKQVNQKIQQASFALPNFTQSVVLQNEIEKPDVSPSNTENLTINLNLPFQVVAGSFQSVRRSNILIEQLAKDGFKAQMSPKVANGNYRIILASFSTEAEAEKYKNQVAQNKNYADTWVLK